MIRTFGLCPNSIPTHLSSHTKIARTREEYTNPRSGWKTHTTTRKQSDEGRNTQQLPELWQSDRRSWRFDRTDSGGLTGPAGGLTVQGLEPTWFWTPHGLTVGLGGLTVVCGGLTAHTPEPREKLSPDDQTEKSRGRTAGRLPETRRTAMNFPHTNTLNPKPNIEF